MTAKARIALAAQSGLRFTPAGIAALLGIVPESDAVAACAELEREGCLDMVNSYYGHSPSIVAIKNHWERVHYRQKRDPLEFLVPGRYLYW